MVGLAGFGVALAGGVGYAAVHRAAEAPVAPSVAPSSSSPADVVLDRRPSPGLDPVKPSPAG
jgi:hypothetical protein